MKDIQVRENKVNSINKNQSRSQSVKSIEINTGAYLGAFINYIQQYKINIKSNIFIFSFLGIMLSVNILSTISITTLALAEKKYDFKTEKLISNLPKINLIENSLNETSENSKLLSIGQTKVKHINIFNNDALTQR